MKQLCERLTTRLDHVAGGSWKRFLRGCSRFGFGAFLWACALLGPARAGVPSLAVAGLTAPQTIQLTLRGDDGTNYEVEVSTNLVFWEPYLALETTNGVAVFNHTLSNTPGPVFFRAAEARVAITPNLSLQPAPFYSQQTIVTPEEGAIVDLLLPDLRHITLTIPPRCVFEPMPFSITLVTNIGGLPFAQGFFGAVTLEPEEFTLMGAAALEIDLPPGLDTREVASFGSGNDGSLFHLVLDRLETNRVMIPISRFATYGSGLATPAEAGGLLAEVRRKRGSGSDPSCPPDPPHLSELDRDYFPKSCNECFRPLVDRALAVESHLRQLERCIIDKSGVRQILANRNQDGAPEDLNALSDLMTNLCPLYTSEILPLWPEAEENCALAQVLLLYIVGVDAQVQKLGLTNLGCKFTLEDNAVAICSCAHECLREIALCCEPGGYKGPQKIQTALAVLRQYQLAGYDCFPDLPDGSPDPDWQEVVQSCATNAWLGSVTFRQKGANDYTLKTADTTTTVLEKVDVLFQGQAGYSYELLPPGEDGFLEIDVGGEGLLRINGTSTDATVVDCTNYTKGTVYMERQFDAVVTTNYVGKTNDNAVADYNYAFIFNLKTNQTYELLVSPSALELSAKTVSKNRSWSTCPPAKSGDSSSTNARTYYLPVFQYPFGTVPTFPWTNADSISGSADWRVTNSYGLQPVVLQTHVDWSFQRNTNVPAFGP